MNAASMASTGMAQVPPELVFERRYRAMSSRDARFDGQFITGVHSTGIYCRPSCPAATPKASNVTFYLTAAAAHEAGLRACKRCLPDAVPGSPEWNLRDDLAGRAMRLIDDGIVEREGVSGLASRLGYTPRHLTRVLSEELGAGPLALARAHRAQTARTLLVGTDMPVSDIAFAAGFGSIRQFNDTIQAVYERTPSALRESARRHEIPGRSGPGSIVLRLPARPPFDADGVFAWLAARTISGVERATDQRFERALRLPAGPAVVRLQNVDGATPGIEIDATLAGLSDLPPLVARVRALFDLDADVVAIDTALAADPALASSISTTPGMRVPGCLDPHELLFRALIGQQISVAAAATALTRLTAELGERFTIGDEEWTLFPSAEAIAARGSTVLRGPAARIRTIVDVARRLAEGTLDLGSGRSRHELETELLATRGIGPWTAGYVAMRVLRDPDVLLTGDLALRAGAAKLGLASEPRTLAAHGIRWSPWRSYASMHLWRAA